MFKRILLAAIAATATILPVGAEVQPGTSRLLETLHGNGVTVLINSETCGTGYDGQYRFLGMKREMILCPGETVDANDHDTVRHETIHAIQHCVNVMRQTPLNSAVIDDHDTFVRFVKAHLSQEAIDWIFETYPKAHWEVELEAFAGANAYTAAELEQMFLKACVNI